MRRSHPDILSRDDLMLIFENSPVSITIADEKERLVFWNWFADELLGLEKKGLNMKHVSRLYPKSEWLKIRGQHLRKNGMARHLETRMYAGDNSLIDVDISINVLKGPEGKITGSVGIARDISQRKKAEQQLLSKTDELEKFNKFAVGRELKMIDLKKRIAALEKRLKKKKD